jgi:hypothetical protein
VSEDRPGVHAARRILSHRPVALRHRNLLSGWRRGGAPHHRDSVATCRDPSLSAAGAAISGACAAPRNRGGLRQGQPLDRRRRRCDSRGHRRNVLVRVRAGGEGHARQLQVPAGC